MYAPQACKARTGAIQPGACERRHLLLLAVHEQRRIGRRLLRQGGYGQQRPRA